MIWSYLKWICRKISVISVAYFLGTTFSLFSCTIPAPYNLYALVFGLLMFGYIVMTMATRIIKSSYSEFKLERQKLFDVIKHSDSN